MTKEEVDAILAEDDAEEQWDAEVAAMAKDIPEEGPRDR